jgi:hypothetical protein
VPLLEAAVMGTSGGTASLIASPKEHRSESNFLIQHFVVCHDELLQMSRDGLESGKKSVAPRR